jgi:hypothetical protein
MAIGDTVQAGLMRVDFSPIARAGEAQARANQAFGDAVGGVINKFYQKKKDKQEREEREQAYLKMGLSDEEAKAASRDKDLANQFINKMNADRNYSLEMEKFNQAGELRDLQVDQIRKSMELADEALISENQFLQTLPSLITNPERQRQADIARPGLPALGNADARNRFLQAQLDDPRNQVPVMNLNDRDFLNQFKDDPQQIKRALAFIEKRNKAQQGTVKTMNVFDPSLGKNVIAVQNPDGTPGRIVGFTPSQPKRIRTPEEEEKIAITTARNQRGLEFAKSVYDQAQSSLATKETAKEALSYLDDIETGGISEAKNSVLKLANSIGIPLSDALKMKIGKTESFMSATGEFLFQSIEKTKGSISDSEMRIFKSINPDIAQTKEGNRIILNYFIKKADRDQELADYVDELEVEGVSPTEIQRKSRQWLKDNDFSDKLEGLKAKGSNTTMPKSKIASTPAGSPSSKPAQNPKFDSQIQQVLQKSSSGAELTDEEQKIIDLINKRELQSKR